MAVQIDERVPEAFRRQILAREGQQPPPATETPAGDPGQDPAAVGSAPPAAEGAVPVSGQDEAQPVVPAEGTPAPEGAAPVVGEPAAGASSEGPAWDPKFLVDPEMSKEKRWKVVSGMISREAKLRNQAEMRVTELERKIEELSSRPAPSAPAAGTSPAQPLAEKGERLRVLQDKLNAGAGDYHKDIVELIELMGFVKASDLDPVRQKVESVSGEVGKVAKAAQAVSQDTFMRELADMAPGYEEKNRSHGFKDFLDTRPPGSLYTYKESAMRANSEGNAPALAEIFNLYEPDTPALPAPSSSRKPDKKYAAPPRTSAPAPVQKPEAAPEMLKQSDYEKLAIDQRNGKYFSSDPVKHEELQVKLKTEMDRFKKARDEGRWIPNPA